MIPLKEQKKLQVSNDPLEISNEFPLKEQKKLQISNDPLEKSISLSLTNEDSVLDSNKVLLESFDSQIYPLPRTESHFNSSLIETSDSFVKEMNEIQTIGFDESNDFPVDSSKEKSFESTQMVEAKTTQKVEISNSLGRMNVLIQTNEIFSPSIRSSRILNNSNVVTSNNQINQIVVQKVNQCGCGLELDQKKIGLKCSTPKVFNLKLNLKVWKRLSLGLPWKEEKAFQRMVLS
jgi:hypothetical protein